MQHGRISPPLNLVQSKYQIGLRRDIIFINRFINEAVAFSGNENRRINYFLLILFNRKGAALDREQ